MMSRFSVVRGDAWLPGVTLLRQYDRRWLRHDVTAGLVMAAMLVPVGIAYAEASGVPGIHGLYATIVPLLAYALVGPSRIIVLGPDSALAAIILGVVTPLAASDASRAADVAAAMALVAGAVCVVAGLMGLGFVTELLSKPIRYGYMNGIALTIILTQVPKLLGFSAKADGPLRQARAIVRGVLAGQGNIATAAVGAGTLAFILAMKRRPRIPGLLIAVAGATALVAAFDLPRAGVAVLGSLPRGLPMPRLPALRASDLEPIVLGGVAAALVAFADTSVLSRTYAARLRTAVDASQELTALGLANVAAGLFQGFPISSSSSRTPVAEAAGARTQVTGVVGAVVVALLLVIAPDLLAFLPQAALAAVVIAAAIGLFEVADLARIRRIQPWEFWLSMVCLAGVTVFGAIPGITIAIAIAVMEFLWDGWRPYSAVLGRLPRISGYHDISRHPDATVIPGLVLFRWDAPLFFANAELFQRRVLEAVAAASTPTEWVVVAAEPVTSVDVTAADTVAELDETLAARGIELCFAELKGPVKDKLKRFGLFARFGERTFYAAVEDAVRAFQARITG